MRIVIADDDAAFRTELADLLRDEGHQVDEANNAAKAIELLEHGEPDLLFTDLKMPRRSGLELLGDVRARWPRVAVVMITGYATVETAVEALKHGAVDYIRKPFRWDQVARTIEVVEASHRFVPAPDLVRDPLAEARRLAEGGAHAVLVVGADGIRPGKGLEVAPLDTAEPSKLLALVDGFVAGHPTAAVVLVGAERLLDGHRVEAIAGILRELRHRLEGHGPLRVAFDPGRLSPAEALALGGAVAAEETHRTLEALASPIRRRLLARFAEGPASFHEAMTASGVEESPKLAFHLRKLVDDELVAHRDEEYRLTARGEAAVSLLREASFLPPVADRGSFLFPYVPGPAP